MPVRIRYKLEVSVSSTTAEEKDLANQKYEVVSDVQGEGGTWKSTLVAAAVNTQLQLGNVANAKLLVLRTNAKDPTQTPGEVRFRRNLVTAEEIVVKPFTDQKEATMLLVTDGLTALFASNPGTVDMEVTVVGAGD